MVPESLELYVDSIPLRRATERLLQLAIECIIDMCAILIKDLRLGPPTDEDSILDLLEVHSDGLQIAPVREMKRFRNVLVHKYGGINDQLVYSVASTRSSGLTTLRSTGASRFPACHARKHARGMPRYNAWMVTLSEKR